MIAVGILLYHRSRKSFPPDPLPRRCSLSLTLYYHPLSSFCQKVLVALYEHGTAFERRIIDLGNEKDRVELLAMSPMGKFPVIRDHTRTRDLAETTIIIEYLDHFFAGERALLPRDWEDALQVRLWDRFFDSYLQVPMQQIVSDRMRGAKGDVTKERATLDMAYQRIDEHMADRAWIAGQGFSMADCAAAPALFYSSTVESFPPSLTHLNAYFERLMERPSVQRVMAEARPYFRFYPFADAIPKRFL
jgi:glutathione S-transferase